jgi:Transposase domain (DUF772)
VAATSGLLAAGGEVVKRIKRARLFVWLREHRHELFDEGLQGELAQMYADRPVGQPPVPLAQLGLATILQAYTGASDDEVLEAVVMDRRWQLVLDCMDHAQAPFSKATLEAFRARLIEHGLDRRLVERTVQLYGQATRSGGPRQAAGGAGCQSVVGGGAGGGSRWCGSTPPRSRSSTSDRHRDPDPIETTTTPNRAEEPT